MNLQLLGLVAFVRPAPLAALSRLRILPRPLVHLAGLERRSLLLAFQDRNFILELSVLLFELLNALREFLDHSQQLLDPRGLLRFWNLR